MRYTDKSHKLAAFAKGLLEKRSLEAGLPHIATYVKEVVGAERCSIFIVDAQKNELWTTLADGVERIVVPSDKGLVGYTIKEKKPIITNDAYSHPHFLAEIDEQTGYMTHNIITAPIFGSNREIIGVLELLNKEGGFDAEDMRFMVFFAHFISGFIELQKTYNLHGEANE